VNLISPYLPELKQRSEARVAQSRDYDYIREDIARYEEIQKDKTALLNEAKRLQEREEVEARRKARIEERKARPASDHTTYEITLAEVDKPGLPEPLTFTNTTDTASSQGMTGHGGAMADDLGESDEELRIDPVLEEAQSILIDYIQLQANNKVVTAGTQREP
jgi:carboxyl-terminal processing protease